MNDFIYQGQIMKFIVPEPDPKNICNLCGGNVGKDNLIQGQAANICFDCSDLAKEIADKERERLSKKEIERIVAVISTDKEGLTDIGMSTTAHVYAERLYKAGYRKVE
ncbi:MULTISPECIES: hypothetical protein [Providencia]|uniref:hypothetical protein n=1 Tax=Providencia TaxID=586 RepID=UPI0010BEB188|nr:hypothetical protein [Providencia rettgeri]QIF66725.1 hypothetical protein FVA72_14960 [Providencia sp. 1709051003]